MASGDREFEQRAQENPAPQSVSVTERTKLFDSIASFYGAAKYLQRRRDAIMTAIGSELARASSVLDLGCGNGVYLAEFVRASNLTRVVGADLSMNMLAEAQRKIGSRVLLVRADISRLSFKPALFDLALCSHVLQFAQDLTATLGEIARVLTPGATLVATLGAPGGMRTELRRLMTDEQWRGFEPAAFARLLRLGRSAPSEQQCRDAYVAAGLSPQLREVKFEVEWRHIEELVDSHWLGAASPSDRDTARRIMGEVARSSPPPIEIEEPLLVGYKPPA